jgi:tagatose-6-phosphate ketose/aldose isomerase
MAGNPSDLISSSNPGIQAWLQALAARRGNFSTLLAGGDCAGFGHTLREICQQPATWTETARHLLPFREAMAEALVSCRRIVLTGSGSSQYAGECVAPVLQRRLGRSVTVAGGGDVLLSRGASAAGEPALVVSLARSGESPESIAVLETLLETERETRHLIITCNGASRLAREFAGTPRVTAIALGEEVNDRSLVMTSSFTNLVLGASFLGWLDRPDEFAATVDRVSRAGEEILEHWPDCLAELVSGQIDRIVFLGSGSRFGSAREGALKLLEMTAGKVATMAETYLGFRHGPMCFTNDRTLVVCFLSADPVIRRYEEDLIRELQYKRLGARKLVAGVGDPSRDLLGAQDLSISYRLPDSAAGTEVLLDAMLAQILGFHRCRMEGLEPDSPSVDGVISRVVGEFRIHRPEVQAQ